SCRHCHLDAGPHRHESMSAQTAHEVIAYAERSRFDVIDITGGAPELNPNIETLIKELSPLAARLMIRSNLSALEERYRGEWMGLLKDHRVVIVASFPSTNEAQADSQRGRGIFQTSLDTLRKLNAMGYGQDGTGLDLDLVSNPTGAFLPTPQRQMEQRFREILKKKWGIVFNHLYSFANVPLGRFRQWLLQSGNLESYLQRLASSFNPCAVEGLMCRTLVSVSWDGILYDCDFNLARDLPMGGRRTHVSHMEGPPEPGSPIAVGDHCYTCTAGAGFT
ncbi:MAG TPA: arsenosugar biosynthesis radical SAM (seleno)protein ArsS, partial [Desulfatiglandales bacterium]|nr:arsenosugar biosynthesis radical SAM (seleno)protein ArsS [Desulfatiglandales bacterium]